MKNCIRLLILVIIFFIIGIILFITGQKHEILMLNNTVTDVKYSVEGAPYKSISKNSKAKFNFKGKSGTLFIKQGDKITTLKVKMDIKGDYELFLKEALSNENGYLKKYKEEVIIQDDENNASQVNDEIKIDF